MSLMLIVGPFPLYRLSLANLLRQCQPSADIQEAAAIDQFSAVQLKRAQVVIGCCHAGQATDLDQWIPWQHGATPLRVLLCDSLGQAQRQQLACNEVDLILPMTVSLDDAEHYLHLLLTDCPPELGLDALKNPVLNDAFLPGMDDLTPRELRVMQHLHQGLSNRAIAAQMEITVNTVKVHLTSIRCKTGSRNRTHALMLYARSVAGGILGEMRLISP